MTYRVSGRLTKKFDINQISDKFKKREFVIEIADGKYPQAVIFQLTGDRCALLDDINEGNGIDVEFNLRGREWTSPKGEVKHFNTLDVWSVKDASNGGNGQRSEPKREGPGQAASDGPPDDDIPFICQE